MKTPLIGNLVAGRVSPSAPTLSRSHAQRSTLHALLGLGISLLAPATFAQTWQTVDDFQYAPGQEAQASGLAVAPNGAIFACGDGTDFSGVSHWLVMASADAGNTWSAPLDDFVYPGQTNNNNLYNSGMAADSAGNLYVAGTAYNGLDNTNHWLVQRSADGGVTWSTVDDFVTVAAGAFLAQPNAIAADAAGNVYVVGGAVYAQPSDVTYWTVRKGIGGTNFSTVDSFPTHDYGSQAQAVFAHPTAGIFVGGEAPVATNKFGNVSFGWVVRRSTNGGATWSVVEAFALSNGYQAVASGIGADALGNIYVVGYGYASAGKGAKAVASSHWVVRKSTSGGTSWSTVDNYQLSSGADSQAKSFVADSQGNLYVAGYGNASNGLHWVVRKNLRGTGAWSTDDDFRYISAYDAQPLAIAANTWGNVFVGGIAYGGASTHWLVRRK